MPGDTHLDRQGLAIAFPFYFAVDRGGIVVDAGPVLTRLVPVLADHPHVTSVFAGMAGQPLGNWDQLDRTRGHLVQVLSILVPDLVLRGQFVLTGDPDVLMFLGSPVVSSMSIILDLGLSISDFALHDPVSDYLVLLQTQAASLSDANNLASAFAALNHELEQRVEQRTASLAAKSAEMESLNAKLMVEIADRHRVEGELRLAQKLESVGQLAAGIAHEINTPIQFIGDNLRFIADTVVQLEDVFGVQQQIITQSRSPAALALAAAIERVDLAYAREELPKAANQGLEGVERVASLVRALKEFSHPDGIELKAVDLNQAVRTTAVVARNEYKYVAELNFELDPTLPQVVCNQGEINQVILNLIVNAAHAIGDCKEQRGMGTITISTGTNDGAVEIRIRDTGTGIPVAVRDRIYDPFFTTKPVGKGTGQGLYLAHAIVVGRHQGVLRFETELGAGTTFIIQLPCLPPGREETRG
jgi:signal transduction histidine kinase